MPKTMELSLEKFKDVGGKYFEQLVAIALDELGYVEHETYLGAWAEACVPGTWVEADFIISKKGDTTHDPLKNGRIVLAIGHATSENSAGMKFHRDVEQLLEVKALPNGDEYRVLDILFCCPRETMGGWSRELVAINEAIFDHSLIVWKHDWGMRLLQQIQLHSKELTQGDNPAKKRKLREMFSRNPDFRRQFEALRDHLGVMLSDAKSYSKIADVFTLERNVRAARLEIPLLIEKPETTDFKRGLLQVLALHPWEVELLHTNHHTNIAGKVYPLEKLALESGMTPTAFDGWWKRLSLLSEKLGTCSSDFIGDEMLDPKAKEWRMFKAGGELAYAFEHFDAMSLRDVVKAVPKVAPNLVPYTVDLQDLQRAAAMCDLLASSPSKDFASLCEECFEEDPWRGLAMPRLLVFEVAKAAIRTEVKNYSYDQIASDSANEQLIRNPFTIRFLAGKQGRFDTPQVRDAFRGVVDRLRQLPADKFSAGKDAILRRFIYERLDGMVKQPKGSVLDALMDAEIRNFAERIGASVTTATVQGLPSAFNAVIGREMAGVNVEIPYVLALRNGQRILVHRVSASEGNAGHKWKEFSSKIRSLRYEASGRVRFRPLSSLYTTVLIVDGNWTREAVNDPLALIRALHVAGWDYVVYPDQLVMAFSQIEVKLAQSSTPSASKKNPKLHEKVIPIERPKELRASRPGMRSTGG